MVLKTKLRVFLKQTQLTIIVNQNLSQVYMVAERNQDKTLEDKIVRAIRVSTNKNIRKCFESEKDQREVVVLSFIMLVCCITNIIK